MAQFDAGEVLTAAALNAAINGRTINNQTASAYTLTGFDAGKIILMSGSVEQTVTIPDNATAAFATGVGVTILANGNANVNVVGASGVTLNSSAGSGSAIALTNAYETLELVKVGTNSWTAIQSGGGGGAAGLNDFLLIGA